ncbi:nuclear transport factor 2 family protein [Micromonospora sp. LOL_023]|uniref:nuclear transport factor 2 family protein n=1 Tax=Micromonospora sp. LOL_023 TaxID=3345418 RepID=UPI003A8741C1
MAAHGANTTMELYAGVQQFYARQMRLLDAGDARAWADTFCDDGVFGQNVDVEPLRGREAIRIAAQRRIDQLAGDKSERRHWLGMLQVGDDSDQSLRTGYYAFAVGVPPGAGRRVYVSTYAEDLLVQTNGCWQVAHRIVRYDGAG